MTGQGIAKAFALLVNVYGARFSIPQEQTEARMKAQVWAELLAEIPDEAGLVAFAAYCKRNSDWPPTPAHILDLARTSAKLPTAGEAWAEVWRAAHTSGYGGGTVPQMSHPEVTEAAQATPWFRICLSATETDLAFAQRDFMRIYDGLLNRSERELDRIALEGPARVALPRMKTVDDSIKSIGERGAP